MEALHSWLGQAYIKKEMLPSALPCKMTLASCFLLMTLSSDLA